MLKKCVDYVKTWKVTPNITNFDNKINETKAIWKTRQQKVNRLSWHEYFILHAYHIATRSLDAQTQCGCVVTKPDHTIIATGYNSFIGGIDDSVLPNLRPEKYPFMIHAEHNAILSCAKNGHSCQNSIAYITGKPCINCLQYMHQSGIHKIYYHKNNDINMVANESETIHFNILKNLSNIELIELEFDQTFFEKICKIKSCH